MKDVTIRQPARLEMAHRHLAICVIQRAVRDLSAAGASQADQDSARAFLSGSPMLEQWCEVADLDSSRMVAGAASLLARRGVRTALQNHTKLKARRHQRAQDQGSRADEDLGHSKNVARVPSWARD